MTVLLASLFSISSLALLFYYHQMLALVAVLLAAVAVSFTLLLSYLQLRYLRPMLELQGKIEGMVFQFLTGISKLRASASEVRAMEVWAQHFAKQKKHFFKANSIHNILTVFYVIFSTLASIILFALMSQIVLDKEDTFTTGDFIAFYAAFGQFLGAMTNLASLQTTILTVIPQWERVKPILQAQPEETAEHHSPGELKGNIEISQVTFRYESTAVLHELSLNIKSGQFVAIVGHSGCGKSTLFRLLLGFETPESGAIYYDEKDLAMLDKAAVRRQIGVVLQNSKITAGTLFEYIVGNSTLTHDDAWQAARLVGLDKDIKMMPMEMHTVLGDGATTLSGGQKQRLMLARALARKPRILLLDEATSALDNKTQAIVIDSLLKLNVTRIVIAHRLSTITCVDKIFVFDKGRVVQEGSYDGLMSAGGSFAELAKRQQL